MVMSGYILVIKSGCSIVNSHNVGGTMPYTTHDWEWLTSQLSTVMTGGWFIIVIPTLYHEDIDILEYRGKYTANTLIRSDNWDRFDDNCFAFSFVVILQDTPHCQTHPRCH